MTLLNGLGDLIVYDGCFQCAKIKEMKLRLYVFIVCIVSKIVW